MIRSRKCLYVPCPTTLVHTCLVPYTHPSLHVMTSFASNYSAVSTATSLCDRRSAESPAPIFTP